MKKTIFLSLFLLVAGFYNASAQRTVTKGGTNTATETTPLKPYYDLKLNVKSHVRGGTDVAHVAGDYIKFAANGTYEVSFGGAVNTGTWKYTIANNNVSITISATTTSYVLTVTSTQVEIKNTNEWLILVKP